MVSKIRTIGTSHVRKECYLGALVYTGFKIYWDVSHCIISQSYIHCVIPPGICFARNNTFQGVFFHFIPLLLPLVFQSVILSPLPESPLNCIKLFPSICFPRLLNGSETSRGLPAGQLKHQFFTQTLLSL